MKMRKGDVTAVKFYKSIKERKKLGKYKLVNGVFIVRYINKEECVYVGDFINHTKTKIINLNQSGITYKYNKRKKMATTSLGVWKPMRIGFKEKNIKEILKYGILEK